ncbi:hypothetical protein [Rubrobacter aplysinae]|uniref:hypothetical protein n=1 Tax=Rubrobacter aplysinae TaxID=909625 RepID=UPI00064BC2C5|nr:hypothetical protein [Rubrobacter aplysinae]
MYKGSRRTLDSLRPPLGAVFLIAYAVSALSPVATATWVFVGSGVLLWVFSVPWANPFHRGLAVVAVLAFTAVLVSGSLEPGGFVEGLPTYYGIVAVLLVLTVAGYPIRAARFERHVGDLLAAMSSKGVGLRSAGGGLGHILGVALDVGSFVLVDAFSSGAPREERLGALVTAGRGFSFIPVWANLNIMTATTITLTGVTYPALLVVALPFVVPGMAITLLLAQRESPGAPDTSAVRPSAEAMLVPLYPLLLVAAVAVTGHLFPGVPLTTIIALTVAAVVVAIAVCAALITQRSSPATRLARETRGSLSASHNEFALFGSAGILVLSLTQLGALAPLGTLFSNLPVPLVAPALAVAIALGFIVGIHAIPMVLLIDAAFPLDAGPSPALWALAVLLGVQCAIMTTPFSSSVTMLSRLTGRHPFEIGPGRNWKFSLVSAVCGLVYLGLLSTLLL